MNNLPYVRQLGLSKISGRLENGLADWNSARFGSVIPGPDLDLVWVLLNLFEVEEESWLFWVEETVEHLRRWTEEGITVLLMSLALHALIGLFLAGFGILDSSPYRCIDTVLPERKWWWSLLSGLWRNLKNSLVLEVLLSLKSIWDSKLRIESYHQYMHLVWKFRMVKYLEFKNLRL